MARQSSSKRGQKWRILTFEEKLNFNCDKLAKEEISNNVQYELEQEAERMLNEITDAPPAINYRLPLETACVYVDGVKQTTEVGKDLKEVIGQQEAKKFYTAMFEAGKGLIPAEAFEVVDWEALKLTLSGKPKMYNVWYSKQCSGWCGTNKKLVE